MYNHPEFKNDDAFYASYRNQTIAAVYEQLTGSQRWANGLTANVPPHMRHGIVEWIAFGRDHMLGGFLKALLSNDLMGAMGKADSTNVAMMREWCNFLYNYAPAGSYGSPEAVESWGGMLRKEDE